MGNDLFVELSIEKNMVHKVLQKKFYVWLDLFVELRTVKILTFQGEKLD